MIRTLALAASVFTIAQSSAFAADMVVEFDRARLDDAAYVESLYDELEAAAKSVCKQELAGSPIYFSVMKTCVETTLAESIEKIGAPLLTAFADGAETQQVASAE
ncbi:UrcA family protein [Hyphococcus sp.]|jgi:UrcA family protein|uniref:UrcA family protein n=1 Tax=Hyphococcus sp. TaxID=2038636 RepID=UPI003D14F3A4